MVVNDVDDASAIYSHASACVNDDIAADDSNEAPTIHSYASAYEYDETATEAIACVYDETTANDVPTIQEQANVYEYDETAVNNVEKFPTIYSDATACVNDEIVVDEINDAPSIHSHASACEIAELSTTWALPNRSHRSKEGNIGSTANEATSNCIYVSAIESDESTATRSSSKCPHANTGTAGYETADSATAANGTDDIDAISQRYESE